MPRAALVACCACALALASAASLRAQTPIVSASGEAERLAASNVSANGARWNIDLTMQPDNANAGLPSSYRRWWACTIGGWNSTIAQTFDVRVLNAGYSDVILPVWSLRPAGSANFGAWQRVPTSALPQVSGSTHRFSLPVPAGVAELRLAKYFPFTVSDKDAWIASLQGSADPHLRRVVSIGHSLLARPIELLEWSDPETPDRSKRRIWIHSGIHPSESTSYFVVQGLIEFLQSNDPRARVLLADAIVDIVPMANPDGVFLGNYRTNAASSNLEDEWAAPYGSAVPEIVALRSAIEQRMGSPAQPAPNPIEVLLNLHSSHNVAFPFHFQHSANANFDLNTSRSGVIPTVNNLEARWINHLRARSPFVQRGSTQTSSCGSPTRPFVECMCHDRWTIQPGWARAVMAITLEGTYGLGAVGSAWNTPNDYRQLGRELGLALIDQLELLPGLYTERFSNACLGGPGLAARALGASGARQIEVQASALAPTGIAVLLLGTQPLGLTLPPFDCAIERFPDINVPLTINAQGDAVLNIPYPPLPAFSIDAQVLQVRDFLGSTAFFTSALRRLHFVPAY